MTQQQREQQAPTSQTLLITPGSAELLTYAHQWVFLHLDTPSSGPQEETLPGEEAEEDSQEEVIPAEAVASQEEEDQEDLPQILWEDIKETD